MNRATCIKNFFTSIATGASIAIVAVMAKVGDSFYSISQIPTAAEFGVKSLSTLLENKALLGGSVVIALATDFISDLFIKKVLGKKCQESKKWQAAAYFLKRSFTLITVGGFALAMGSSLIVPIATLITLIIKDILKAIVNNCCCKKTQSSTQNEINNAENQNNEIQQEETNNTENNNVENQNNEIQQEEANNTENNNIENQNNEIQQETNTDENNNVENENDDIEENDHSEEKIDENKDFVEIDLDEIKTNKSIDGDSNVEDYDNKEETSNEDQEINLNESLIEIKEEDDDISFDQNSLNASFEIGKQQTLKNPISRDFLNEYDLSPLNSHFDNDLTDIHLKIDVKWCEIENNQLKITLPETILPNDYDLTSIVTLNKKTEEKEKPFWSGWF